MGHLHRLIAFDLDGTLVDSRRDLADSANDLVIELGGPPLAEDDIARMVGEGAALLVKRALAAARVEQPPDAVARFLDFYNRRLLKHTRPYPGIPDVVRQAREHARVVVLTNKPREPSERILEGLGMRDLFDEIAGGDGPMPRKPDPTALRALMETAGSTEATTLMVGDSPIDYQTARNAGVQYCLVSFGFGFSNFTSDESVESEWIVSDTDGLADRIRKFAHQ